MTIDDLAARVGMSRAVFHRRFKEATTCSPIQFAKVMRLTEAAMRIVAGTTVNAAAMDVGYASASQFSRESKRMYGRSARARCGSRACAAWRADADADAGHDVPQLHPGPVAPGSVKGREAG